MERAAASSRILWRSLLRSAPPDAAESEASALTASRTRQRMNDAEITDNLWQQHGWKRADMGSGGNCLFLSIAPQISASEVAKLPECSPEWSTALGGSDLGKRWEALDNLQRAHVLRRVAMLDEADWIRQIGEMRTRGVALQPQDRWRMMELYKDMAEEFISSGKTQLAIGVSSWDLRSVYQRVRKLARETPLDEIIEFVQQHMPEYMATTGKEGNWAGSSEMAALANALQRSFEAYGNNWISQDEVEVDLVQRGRRVRPYFEALVLGSNRPPVRVFQTNGGGHYQLLAES